MSIPKELTAKYAGTCGECGRSFKKGTRIIYNFTDRKAYHLPQQCRKWSKKLVQGRA